MAVKRLRFEGSSWNSIPVTIRALPTRTKRLTLFVIDHNEEHIILGKYFGFISIELSETQHQEF